MNSPLRILLLLAFALALPSAARTGEPIKTKTSAGDTPVLATVDGKEITPLSGGNSEAFVLFFITTECPVANSYAPEINRIVEDFSNRKVAFTLIHPEADLSDEAAREHAEEYGFAAPVAIDRQHQLVERARVGITPEAAVFDRSGVLRYHGRIDDLYADFGKRRRQPTTRDLRDAIEAVLAGKAPPAATAPAVGCTIEPLKE